MLQVNADYAEGLIVAEGVLNNNICPGGLMCYVISLSRRKLRVQIPSGVLLDLWARMFQGGDRPLQGP